MTPGLHKFIGKDFVLHSRVHPLNQGFEDALLYIKREDELSSGIAGSKYRKLASLLPFLNPNKYDEVVLIGSAQSNNIIGALQLLNETEIKCKLFLLESNENELKGNLLWMHLLHDMSGVIWLSREKWRNVEEIALNYQESQKRIGKKVFILPEGGLTVEAMPGAVTLAYDIAENEKESEIEFGHIFIDSGSGATAIGLLLGLQLLKKKCDVHITLIAGTETEFRVKYGAITNQFEDYTGMKLPPEMLFNLHFHMPIVSPSFGSITKTILNELKSIARQEGILMDPIYSVKHLMTVRQVIHKESLTSNLLFVYSGGSFALSGFQEMLAKGI